MMNIHVAMNIYVIRNTVKPIILASWILQYLCGYENLYIQYCFHYGTDSIYAWSMINIRCYVERRVRVCQSYTLCHKKTGPLKLFIITLRKLL